MRSTQTKVECPICGKMCGSELFCSTCRYPLNVKKLADFSEKDLDDISQHLLEVMGLFNKENDVENPSLYHQAFSVNWLRPESALFDYLSARTVLKNGSFINYPLLDLGCGDGIFTTLLFGGEFKEGFDNYGFVDINKTDVYNNYTGNQKDALEKRPPKIGMGIDIKESSVKNAKDLEVYDDVVVGDIRETPFEEAQFNTVFSTMVDDIEKEDLPDLLKEIRRVLSKEGHLIFITPTAEFRDNLFYRNRTLQAVERGEEETAKKLSSFDRGRSKWEPRSQEFWKEMLDNNGFELIRYDKYFSKNLMLFWDTGFRPYFPRIMEALKGSNVQMLKKIMIKIFENHFADYLRFEEEDKGSFAIVVAKTR